MKRPVFTGAAVAIITPMNTDGSVNYDELGRIIDDQIAHSTDAIVICGTTGESPTLTDEELALYQKVKATYLARTKTRCTGCKYCQPCPMGVQIPRIFQGYDAAMLRADSSFKAGYAQIQADHADASQCIHCRKCERVCPQHLPITRFLEEIHAASTAE